MRISKEFIWEMSHRLPFLDSPCKNIHGHSYKMRVEIEGDLNELGMVLDYYDLASIVKPLIKSLDHSFICDKNDAAVIEFLEKNNFKHHVIDSYTTAENLVIYFIDELKPKFIEYPNINTLKIRVNESIDVFAEKEIVLR